jgi:hypothetical protein
MGPQSRARMRSIPEGEEVKAELWKKVFHNAFLNTQFHYTPCFYGLSQNSDRIEAIHYGGVKF